MTMRGTIAKSLLALVGALTPVGLGCQPSTVSPVAPPATPAAVTAPDGDWVSISGTVVATADDAFTVDYGNGTIIVEMDDWDWYPEGRALLIDDDVVVYGFVDDDFFEQRSIEASSVYVRDLGTQFYASGVDEEDFATVTVVEMDPAIEVIGRVGQVQGREFQLHTGTATLDVDTSSMGYDPLDQEGFQQLRTGDRVRVRGDLDVGLFDDLDLVAESIVTLASSDARGDASGTEAGSAVTSRRDRRADDSGRRAAMR